MSNVTNENTSVGLLLASFCPVYREYTGSIPRTRTWEYTPYMYSRREERNSQAVLLLAPPEGAGRRRDVRPEAEGWRPVMPLCFELHADESAASDKVSSRRDNHPITDEEITPDVTEFYSCC